MRDSDNYLFYKDIKPSSIAISDKHGLTYTQTRVYDYLSRGDYYLGDNDISMYFNPADKGIGYSHDSKWARKLLEPLVEKGLIKKRKDQSGIGPAHDRGYEYWHKDFKIEYLVDGSCFVTTSIWNDIKKRLHLPDGWFASNNGNYNGRDFRTDINSGNSGIMTYKNEIMIMTHSSNGFRWVHDVIGMLDSVDKKVRLSKSVNITIESLRREYDKTDSYPFVKLSEVDRMKIYDKAYYSNYFLNGARVYKDKDFKTAKDAEKLAATKRNKSNISDSYIDSVFKEATKLIKEEVTDTANTLDKKLISIIEMMKADEIGFKKDNYTYETDCFIFNGRVHNLELFPDGWYQIISSVRERYINGGDKKTYEVYESGKLPYKEEDILKFYNDKIKTQQIKEKV